MSIIKNKLLHTGLAAIILAALVTGCAIGPLHFKRAVSAAETFEAYQVLPDHQYYYSGRWHKPWAIIALQSDYKLESSDWNTVDLDERQLRNWINRMVAQPGAEYNTEPNGAYILDSQGERIGVWYSVWTLPLLTFKSEKVVAVSRPNTIFPYSNRNPGGGEREGHWPGD